MEEAREQLAKEKASKNAAWKVVGQLTKQLQAVKGGASDDTGDTFRGCAREEGQAAAEEEGR